MAIALDTIIDVLGKSFLEAAEKQGTYYDNTGSSSSFNNAVKNRRAVAELGATLLKAMEMKAAQDAAASGNSKLNGLGRKSG